MIFYKIEKYIFKTVVLHTFLHKYLTITLLLVILHLIAENHLPRNFLDIALIPGQYVEGWVIHATSIQCNSEYYQPGIKICTFDMILNTSVFNFN